MGCNKPLIRFYVPHNREASGRVYSLASFNKIHKTKMKYEDLMYRKDVMMIPCGQCTGCKLRKRKDWATRMELEAYSHDKESIWFITLTYDDDHVPTQNTETGEIFKGGVNVWRDASERPRTVQTLNVEDIQLFMKRLRKAVSGPLRYFLAGEYGDNTSRPHYHMILYGWNPDDLKPIHRLSRFGHYTSDKLIKVWGQGTVDIAQATPETYNYVAGYVTKKLYGNDKDKYKKMGLIPPFCVMSRKPGLGDAWFQENQERLWQQGYIQLTNGKRAAIPEYYWRKLEGENPEKAWRIKKYRQEKAIASLIERNMETDKRYAEQLTDKEAAMKKKMSKAKGVF